MLLISSSPYIASANGYRYNRPAFEVIGCIAGAIAAIVFNSFEVDSG
jgi:hypothetical protein